MRQVNTSSERSAHLAGARYLKVRYGEAPETRYPRQLTEYLVERFLVPEFNQGRLLELGLGRGEFLEGFEKQGFLTVGIDRTNEAGSLYSGPVVTSDLIADPLPFTSNSIDVVFNKSVLEHLHDVDPVLKELRRVMVSGGLMISMVPDWKAQWRHFYDDYTHVRPFTLTGLVQLLESWKFDIEHAQRFRQLPFVWRYPVLHLYCDLLSLLPEYFKKYKAVRFAKEWMLLVVARNP